VFGRGITNGHYRQSRHGTYLRRAHDCSFEQFKSNKRSDKKNDEIRSLIKDQSPIRILTIVLDQ